MFDSANHISALYEDYMLQNCTCDRSDEDCNCMSFEKFEENYLQDLRDQWEHELAMAYEERLECQI
jgi:hypothetical protein